MHAYPESPPGVKFIFEVDVNNPGTGNNRMNARAMEFHVQIKGLDTKTAGTRIRLDGQAPEPIFKLGYLPKKSVNRVLST